MDMKLVGFTLFVCFSLSQQVPTGFFEEKNEESGRIHGGRNAIKQEFPWMVYLEIGKEDDYSICGGTVISNNYVLTAAHCVCSNATLKTYAKLKEIRGKFGIVDINDGKSIEFDKLIVHEDYNEAVNADVALLKFKDPLKKTTKGVAKICLADKGAKFANRQSVVQMGWGQMENDSDSETIILQTTDAGYLLDNSSCKREMKTYYDSGQLCVSNFKGPKVCEGDSGGPLVIKNGANSLAVGIASFVLDEWCIEHDYPSIFVDISFYAGWIKDKTKDKEICWKTGI